VSIAAARRIIDAVSKPVPHICPRCGEMLDVAVRSKSSFCFSCQVWAVPRPDLRPQRKEILS
jgi:predicted RNA-binding Zn-ribbon protein involved in translation (DUF1610 family)